MQCNSVGQRRSFAECGSSQHAMAPAQSSSTECRSSYPSVPELCLREGKAQCRVRACSIAVGRSVEAERPAPGGKRASWRVCVREAAHGETWFRVACLGKFDKTSSLNERNETAEKQAIAAVGCNQSPCSAAMQVGRLHCRALLHRYKLRYMFADRSVRAAFTGLMCGARHRFRTGS